MDINKNSLPDFWPDSQNKREDISKCINNFNQDEKILYFSQQNLETQFKVIKEIQENSQEKTSWALFMYLFRSKIIWTSWAELHTFVQTLSHLNNRETFDNIRLLRTILTYINLKFETNLAQKYIEDANLSQEIIDRVSDALKEICNNALLEQYRKVILETLIEQLQDRENTNRISKNYQAIKVKWNNISIDWHKYGTISRISSDFISFWSQQKSLWLSHYELDQEESFSESETIYNDAYRLYDNIFEIYIQDKYSDKIKTKHDFIRYSQEESLPSSFPIESSPESFLINIVFYVLNDIENNTTKLQKVLEHIFWTQKSYEIVHAFHHILTYFEKYENPIFALRSTLISQENWDIKNTIISIFQNALSWSSIQHVKDKRIQKDIHNYKDILASPTIDIYGNESPETLALLIENLHEPQFLTHINNDIWIDIRKLSLQIQVHLMRYLWETNEKEYQKFKTAINLVENKYDFISTFLTCSKNLKTWNSIIDIAQLEWSMGIYYYSSKIIALQNNFQTNEIEMNGLLKAIVNRLTKMYESINKWDKIQKYQNLSLYLWKASLNIKKLVWKIQAWEYISIEDFNKLKTWFKLDYFKWWEVVKNWEEIDMQLSENYINNQIFSIDMFHTILGWIEKAHSFMDPDFMQYATPYMWHDFNNPNCSFLFLKEDPQEGEVNTQNLSWTSKIEDKWNEYYFWTHYLNEELQWDFSIWLFLEKMIQKISCTKNIPVTWTVMLWNKTFIQRIEWKWDIATSIERYNQWKTKPFIKVEWNYHEKFISKYKDFNYHEYKNDERIQLLTFCIPDNDFSNFEQESIKMFEQWFVITRIFTTTKENNLKVIYEKRPRN